MLVDVCRQNTVARLLINESVRPYETSSQKVEDNIYLLGNIHLVADIIPPGVHFVMLLGRCPSFSICFLIYLSLLHEFRSKGIGFGLRLFASLAE